MALNIDWDSLSNNYMRDVRAYAIEVGATSTVLLASLIAGKLLARAAVHTGRDFLFVGEGAFNAAIATIEAKGAALAGRSLFGRILVGAARATVTVGRSAFIGVKGISATAMGWLLGSIMAVDTASEAADLIWRLRSLGTMTLRHIPYDEGDIELLVRLFNNTDAKTESRDLVLTKEQCALLVLLASPYSDARLTADTKSALVTLYRRTLESDDGSNLFTLSVRGSDAEVTRVIRFAEALSKYYGSFAREDLLILNIAAITLGKLKIKPGFKVAARILAIGG